LTEAQIAALVEEWGVEYDRLFAAYCECLLASDAFPTAQECLDAYGFGDSWAECSAAALSQTDAGQVFSEQDARCVIEEAAARADCMQAAGCEPEATGACVDISHDCPMLSNDLVSLVLELCPDTGLLSR
jgi:hypothetical protein